MMIELLSDMKDFPTIRIGDDSLRFELDPLSETGKQVAIKELRETPTLTKQAVEDLRILLKGINLQLYYIQI